MSKKTKYSLLVLFLGLSVVTLSLNVSANSPSNIALLYDFGTQTLDVTVFHSVADPGTHYIEDIIIWVNDVLNQSQGYTSQDSATQHHDTFIVPAVHNDVIKVEAICNIAGNIIDTVTVQNPAVPELSTILPLVIFTLFSMFLGYLIIKKRRD
jgi:hypothetical protein